MYEQKYLQEDLGFVRPKYIVLEGLQKKIAEMGTLATSFDVTFEYPRQEAQANDPRSGQTKVRRRIVIKKVQAVPSVQGIGQTYANNMYLDENMQAALEAEGVGQVDTHTIEISVWSPSASDRDLLLELIRVWMLELNRNVEENATVPFFYGKGVYAVNEVRHYETIDRAAANTPFHVGIIVYNLLSPFYAVHTDRFRKYKYDIINQIIDNTDGPGDSTTLPGDTVFVPNPPTTPPTGGGGGSVPNDGTVVVPENGGRLDGINIGSSHSDRNGETLIIPGPNTEERTVQSVVFNTEE